MKDMLPEQIFQRTTVKESSLELSVLEIPEKSCLDFREMYDKMMEEMEMTFKSFGIPEHLIHGESK